MHPYIVNYGHPDITHRLTGVETLIDSAADHSFGAISGGAQGSGDTLCGERVYGVMGLLTDGAVPGLCPRCEATWNVQRRGVVPAGWSVAERDAYWVGFDRGRSFADFMEHYRADAFGDETIVTPWTVSGSGSPTLIARFDEGAEDGVRSYVIDGWTPRW